MSTKTFCDSCGDELLPFNSVTHRDEEGDARDGLVALLPKTRVRRTELRVRVAVDSSGDFCKKCVLAALDSLDDRPRQAPADRPVLPSVGDFVYRNGTRHKVKSVGYGDPADDLGTMTCAIVAEVG